MSGVPSRGDPTPATPGYTGDARAGDAGAGPVRDEVLGEQVREALAGLDEAELAAHPEVFETLSAAIVAELRGLEEL